MFFASRPISDFFLLHFRARFALVSPPTGVVDVGKLRGFRRGWQGVRGEKMQMREILIVMEVTGLDAGAIPAGEIGRLVVYLIRIWRVFHSLWRSRRACRGGCGGIGLESQPRRRR